MRHHECLTRRAMRIVVGVTISFLLWCMLSFDMIDPSLSDPKSDFRALHNMSIVFTWVDSSDTAFLTSMAEQGGPRLLPNASQSRVRDSGELRHSLHALSLHMPWHVGPIFIVTPPLTQRPAWLTNHPRVVLINQNGILPERVRPTFNSHTIEKYLHRIPSLSDLFLFMNDDFFITARMDPWDFFTWAPDSSGGHFGIILRLEIGTIRGGRTEATEFKRQHQKMWLSSIFNTRGFLEESLSSSLQPLHYTKHAPYAYCRQVLASMEKRWGGAYEENAIAHKFRSHDDFVVPMMFQGVVYSGAHGLPYRVLMGPEAEATFVVMSDDENLNSAKARSVYRAPHSDISSQ